MTLFLAHRGMSRRALENTLPAFELALAYADGVELDVQLAACGTPVVFHDDTLARLFGVDAPVGDFSYKELALLEPVARPDLPDFDPRRSRIPCLDDVLCTFPAGFLVNVELKSSTFTKTGLSRSVAECLAKYRHLDLLVSSFNPLELLRFSKHTRDLPLAYLFDDPLPYFLGTGWPVPLLRQIGLAAIHPNFRLVSIRMLEIARERDLAVNVWTVNEAQRAHWLAAEGVSAIISDVPDLVRPAA